MRLSENRVWGNFTFLFKTRRRNPIDPPDPMTTNPLAAARRRKLEAIGEERELRRKLKEVWE